ncbi:MAG: aryl-sulfate sulfotransferase [Candidatus Gracilibacteria bacterium]|jgi:outer membrane protein assembly factor BamB
MKKNLAGIITLVLFFGGCGNVEQIQEDAEIVSDPEVVEDTIEVVTSEDIANANTDPAFEITVYDSSKAYNGTTIFSDNHDGMNPRIVEVNMLGEVVWEYDVPKDLAKYNNPGFDVEKLENGNILFILPGNGIYEVDQAGETVWSYLDTKISHDIDRLPNGNTLVVFGNRDTPEDAQVKEISPEGEIVWSWQASSCFTAGDYKQDQGWTHTNAATRLDNGNTLVSLRNFSFIAEIDTEGNLVRKIGEGVLEAQHDPKMEEDGEILLANHTDPNTVLTLNPDTGEITWEYVIEEASSWPVRGADRLPNGNVLITEADRLVEITVDGEIVWELALKDPIEQGEGSMKGFFTSQRIQ